MLAAVLVTVLDLLTGLPVPGLTAADFQAPTPVVSVAVADAPLAVLLVMDDSAAGDGVRRVGADVLTQMGTVDRVAVTTFRGGAVASFGGDGRKALDAVRFQGDPRMMDALLGVLDSKFPASGYRKVVLLVTAGIEGPNRATEAMVAAKAREKGIALYPVYLHGSGRWTFPELARQTGGAAFWLREVKSAAAIVAAVRGPYLLTLQGAAAAGTIKVKGREKTFVSSLPWLNQ